MQRRPERSSEPPCSSSADHQIKEQRDIVRSERLGKFLQFTIEATLEGSPRRRFDSYRTRYRFGASCLASILTWE